MHKQNKNLGQHWLVNQESLDEILRFSSISASDTVLEIGPGKGALTERLTEEAGKVIAVELDDFLAKRLGSFLQAENLDVLNQNILDFDLSRLPKSYKVVANVPYYITSAIIRKLLTSDNKPTRITLLVQKEVADRIAAPLGKRSLLSVSVEFYADVELGANVPAEHFSPKPKVDSRIIALTPQSAPMFEVDEKRFFRVVKAGFGERRKKLVNSLAGGLKIDKPTVEEIVLSQNLSPNVRAQELSLSQWYNIYNDISERR